MAFPASRTAACICASCSGAKAGWPPDDALAPLLLLGGLARLAFFLEGLGGRGVDAVLQGLLAQDFLVQDFFVQQSAPTSPAQETDF